MIVDAAKQTWLLVADDPDAPVVAQMPTDAELGDRVRFMVDRVNGVYWTLQYAEC